MGTAQSGFSCIGSLQHAECGPRSTPARAPSRLARIRVLGTVRLPSAAAVRGEPLWLPNSGQSPA
jgi:hypothetical protein